MAPPSESWPLRPLPRRRGGGWCASLRNEAFERSSLCSRILFVLCLGRCSAPLPGALGEPDRRPLSAGLIPTHRARMHAVELRSACLRLLSCVEQSSDDSPPTVQSDMVQWTEDFQESMAAPQDWTRLKTLMSKRITVHMPHEPTIKKFEDWEKKCKVQPRFLSRTLSPTTPSRLLALFFARALSITVTLPPHLVPARARGSGVGVPVSREHDTYDCHFVARLPPLTHSLPPSLRTSGRASRTASAWCPRA